MKVGFLYYERRNETTVLSPREYIKQIGPLPSEFYKEVDFLIFTQHHSNLELIRKFEFKTVNISWTGRTIVKVTFDINEDDFALLLLVLKYD